MNKDIIKDDGDLRVSLVLDEYAEEPYNDGQSPLLRIDRTGNYASAEHVMATGRPLGDDERIEEAATRWARSSDHNKLEKYLRAFYGTTQVKWYGPNQATDYTYVSYDTANWRKAVGAPEKSVSMDSYISYLEGDVYFYVVEKRVTEERIVRDLSGKVINRETTDAWDAVDSCHGFYGHEYAEEAALEAFESEKR